MRGGGPFSRLGWQRRPRTRSPVKSEHSSAEAVFCEALEKQPAERAAFLDRACAGNEPLRREVQSLLDAHQKAGLFLERPLAESEGVADLAAAEATDPGDALPFLAPSPEPGSLGRLVQLRFFAGLSTADAAAALRISVATAERWWTFARAWLYRELQGGGEAEE